MACVNYRFAGKQKTLALGGYPDVSLAEARDKRDEARKLLSSDLDPGAERKQTKAAQQTAAENTFEAVAREWLGKQHWADTTRAKAEWMLGTLTFPWMGTRPIAEVTAPELLAVLRRIESRGSLHTAQVVKQRCGQIFSVMASPRGAVSAILRPI